MLHPQLLEHLAHRYHGEILSSLFPLPGNLLLLITLCQVPGQVGVRNCSLASFSVSVVVFSKHSYFLPSCAPPPHVVAARLCFIPGISCILLCLQHPSPISSFRYPLCIGGRSCLTWTFCLSSSGRWLSLQQQQPTFA